MGGGVRKSSLGGGIWIVVVWVLWGILLLAMIPLMRSGDYVPWEVGGLLPGRYLGIRVL